MITCVSCELEYKTAKIGTAVESMTQDGPYKLYAADMLVCPGCGHTIMRTAATPMAEHFQTEYTTMVANLESRGLVVRSWTTAKEKEAYGAQTANR